MELHSGEPNQTKKGKIIPTTKKMLGQNLTHLHLEEKYLITVPTLEYCNHLEIIYLHRNKLRKIENLNWMRNLTSLYLQQNQIEKIENLSNLIKLKKLYLGHNRITVIEGMENLERLEELHIEKQDLSRDMSLCIDPRTVAALSVTLQVLNISHNKLTIIAHLSPLINLRSFNASHNELDDIKDICQTIRNWYYLRQAKFTGNEIAKQHRYREDIIANTHQLEILDDKTITDITRNFIKRFEESKLVSGSKQSINLADHIPGLPKNYPTTLQKAVSVSMIKDSNNKLVEDLSTFDESNAAYVAWQKLPKRRPFVKSNQQMRTAKFQVQQKKVVINTFPQINNF